MDYKYIRAWGKMMGSFPYYIEGEVERARRENAPADAVYKKHDGSNEWQTFHDIQSEDTKNLVSQLLYN